MYSDLFQVSDIYSIIAYLASHTRIKKKWRITKPKQGGLVDSHQRAYKKVQKDLLDELTNLDVAKRSDDCTNKI
jgi:hypothetical protein